MALAFPQCIAVKRIYKPPWLAFEGRRGPTWLASQHLIQLGQLLVDMIQVGATVLVIHLELADILRKQACEAKHNRCFMKNYGLGLGELGLFGHLGGGRLYANCATGQIHWAFLMAED
ncbi:MAG: hypothetical protein MJH10_18000, partial [Epibacterium sp.]|nr:hypothetical protein [Epibacterium sp.]NQX75385.1 hypothetical protein [Epibacterium sp.]